VFPTYATGLERLSFPSPSPFSSPGSGLNKRVWRSPLAWSVINSLHVAIIVFNLLSEPANSLPSTSLPFFFTIRVLFLLWPQNPGILQSLGPVIFTLDFKPLFLTFPIFFFRPLRRSSPRYSCAKFSCYFAAPFVDLCFFSTSPSPLSCNGRFFALEFPQIVPHSPSSGPFPSPAERSTGVFLL